MADKNDLEQRLRELTVSKIERSADIENGTALDYKKRGDTRLIKQEYDGAIADYCAAMELDSSIMDYTHLEIACFHGACEKERKREYSRACLYMKKLLSMVTAEQISPERFEIYIEKEEKLLEKNLEENCPEENFRDPIKFFILAAYCHLHKKYKKAEEFARKTIDCVPFFAPAYALLVKSLNDQGRSKEAGPYLKKVAELEPHFYSFFDFAVFCIQNNNNEEGIIALEKAVEAGSDIKDEKERKECLKIAYYFLSFSYKKAGMHEKAELAEAKSKRITCNI